MRGDSVSAACTGIPHRVLMADPIWDRTRSCKGHVLT